MTTPAAPPPFSMSVQQKLYLWLAAVSAASLVIADVLGPRLFRIPLGFSFNVPWSNEPIDAIEHSCGMLTFPITFLLTDLINEYYGKKAARRVTYIALAMGGLAFVVVNVALAMPGLQRPYNISDESFRSVFASSRLMFVASLCAYIVGQLCDISVFGLLKRRTGGRMIWLRATGSTVVSQIIDSFIVTYLGFLVLRHAFPDDANPPMDFASVLKTGATGYLLKFVMALAVTPLIYAGHTVFEKWFGLRPLPAEER